MWIRVQWERNWLQMHFLRGKEALSFYHMLTKKEPYLLLEI